jgi:SAM-dependent methyltransferase
VVVVSAKREDYVLHLRSTTPFEEVLKVAQEWCDRDISARRHARVLDAGSGLQSYVEFPAHVHVTGVDVSRELLERNPRLDERVHGDLQELELPERSYDCVICWEVLEHLEDPEPVAVKLGRAVADNGLLIIGSPNPHSIKGLVTRFTPYAFHLWVYRRFFNPEATHEVGAGPYRTFMKSGGGVSAVRRAAEQVGLTNVYTAWVESVMQVTLRERFHITGRIWDGIRHLTHVLSFGRIQADASDYLCIFERPAEHQTKSGPVGATAQG